MANSAPATRPAHSTLLRTLAIFLLALILLVAIAVIVIWLAVKPKKLVYTIESGSIHNYNLTNNHLNATFNFELRAYNPNSRVSIYYDRIESTVYYDDQTLAVNSLQPFHQPKRNVTRLNLNFVSTNVELFPGVAKNLQMEKMSREVELEIRVKAKIRFKVGAVKNHRTLRLLCAPVVVPFSSSKSFERTPCDIDL
ncbi:OLC1v1003749C1 [Oldenlandia corymbosa var. corymbosa]|uniref:OLC1v1003749C1 n=1 Tax=Oldenlandia corymbosa var. corymbosa TaxID=529605 RepID=A0AAV1DD34_OLDCO|nr:OLC1v1003749C1 [Oldenlandia corymbosa var. corymbosa]